VSGLEVLKDSLETRLAKAEERVTALERENAELLTRIKELEEERA
jgi:chaperonin cofactor prefoldin